MSTKRSRRQRSNVVSVLNGIDYLKGNTYRTKYKIMSILATKGDYEFRKVWELTSKDSFDSSGDYIFSENLHKVYYGYGAGSAAPVLKYTIGKGDCPWRFKQIILQPQTLDDMSHRLKSGQHHGPLVYGLSEQGSRILVFDHRAGNILHNITLNLNNGLKWKELAWCERMTAFFASTTEGSRHSGGNIVRRGHGDNENGWRGDNVVKTVAIFDVTPLRFRCMFDITRNVFGKDVKTASYHMGFLAVEHLSGIVRLYDMPAYLSHKQITPVLCKSLDSFSCNVEITELPQLVFELQGNNEPVAFGMTPHNFLATPKRGNGRFRDLYTVADHDMVKDGRLNLEETELGESGDIMFHPDDSNRLISMQKKDIKVYSLVRENGTAKLRPTFTLPLVRQTPRMGPASVLTTQSGRVIKKRFNMADLNDVEVRILNVDYEDELDVLWSFHTEKSDFDFIDSYLQLYDNNSGKLLRRIQLEQPDPDYLVQSIDLNMDSIYQVIKMTSGKYVCKVYRLCEKNADGDDDIGEDSAPTKSKKTDNRRSTSPTSRTSSRQRSRSPLPRSRQRSRSSRQR